jgi:copper chaperone
MSEVSLRIENMHCGACVRRVTQTLNAIPGVHVEEVQIGAARVNLADGAVTPAALAEAVAKAGYPAHLEK